MQIYLNYLFTRHDDNKILDHDFQECIKKIINNSYYIIYPYIEFSQFKQFVRKNYLCYQHKGVRLP